MNAKSLKCHLDPLIPFPNATGFILALFSLSIASYRAVIVIRYKIAGHAASEKENVDGNARKFGPLSILAPR